MPKTNNQACLNLFGLGISFFKAELCWEGRSQSLVTIETKKSCFKIALFDSNTQFYQPSLFLTVETMLSDNDLFRLLK